uniref:Arp2/3 complex 41 kDa subunit n=1 Tax=Arcella intermedia TaxID=1963864 RepID=A0A6B2L9V1_9EUKA|eukprot:TRINITY_DN24137_c0_g1_i1.p1 TRINITY_DN24137_c0_g1~~TRINITY_DN24137_c0_g1_i1.p1  ORF type:complete len:347 (-),score=55.16 TRINITY_DN24137_c0_g1_i1:45-1016(-)
MSGHSWSPDGRQIAITFHHKKSLWIYEYETDPTTFRLLHRLKGHSNPITSLEWSKKHGHIVTTSTDSTAMSWTYDAHQRGWSPRLILLRSRCSDSVHFSPLENKIGIAGTKSADVYYEENGFWFAKPARRGINAKVNCLCWHPDNILMGVGSMDKLVCVYSVLMYWEKRYVKANGSHYSSTPFGQLLFSLQVNAGVNAISWSPSGKYLCWFTRDSMAYLMEWGNRQIHVLHCSYLPFRDCLWVNEEECVAVGYSNEPVLFCFLEGRWQVKGSLDNKKNSREYVEVEGELPTYHQNCITSIQLKNAKTLSTSGDDGNLVLWNLQ